MSDKGPTITVTRGSKENAPEDQSRSSSGFGLPGLGTLVSGLVRGARNAWWAGLGVLAVAETVGSQVFDALVEEGKSWEQQRRERTEARFRQVQELAGDGETVEAVEERVREEVDTVLRRIGVPRRGDLEELHEQVDALRETIERLSESVEEAEGEYNA